MRTYLLECFENEENTEDLTSDEKFIHIRRRFESEYLHGHNIELYMDNHINVLKEWISGLAISCDYTYYDIIKVNKKLHDLNSDYVFCPDLENIICEYWFELLAIYIDKNYTIAFNKLNK